MSFKDLLKRILPPPVHAFNREVARILDAVDQSRRETGALRELIAAQERSLDQLRSQLDGERKRRLQWESQARDEWRAQQQAALDKMRPGLPLHEAYTLARGVFEKAGVEAWFTHGLGHGVGLETHEAPSLGRRGDKVLQEGMVVTVEPGLYYPQWGGIRWEYTVLITADGNRIL